MANIAGEIGWGGGGGSRGSKAALNAWEMQLSR